MKSSYEPVRRSSGPSGVESVVGIGRIIVTPASWKGSFLDVGFSGSKDDVINFESSPPEKSAV